MGDIELDGNVLVIKRIRVHYTLRAGEEHRDAIERVHQFHADRCPVARSIKGAIDVQTSFTVVQP